MLEVSELTSSQRCGGVVWERSSREIFELIGQKGTGYWRGRRPERGASAHAPTAGCLSSRVSASWHPGPRRAAAPWTHPGLEGPAFAGSAAGCRRLALRFPVGYSDWLSLGSGTGCTLPTLTPCQKHWDGASKLFIGAVTLIRRGVVEECEKKQECNFSE